MRFDGFTEGDKLSRGDVDVVVTDGFSGNIALKTAEGTARFVTDLLRRAFTSSLRSKAGFALSQARAQPAQDPPRPQQSQWRGLPRPQRAGGEKPRRRQLQGRRQRDRASPRAWCATTSPARSARISTISAPTPSPTGPPNDASSRSSAAPARRCPSAASTMPSWPTMVDTTDEWIVERTGIRSRYIAGEGETTATLATDAARARARRGRDRRRRHRPHRPRHRDPRPDLPLVRDQGPGRARDRRLHRLRRPRGVHRLPLRADRRRFDAARRQREARAGDRRGDLQPHPRLGRPQHLRPVRRRRRRAGAVGRGRRTRASSPPGSTPTAATTTCSTSTAAPRPPARSASCA